MRVKIYQASNIGAAMAMVRDELGPDALILASESVEDGVEVTAAHETPPTPAPETAVFDPDWTWHGVQVPLADKLAQGDLINALQAEFAFASLPCHRSASSLLLVGPPGAGKTMTTARLATRLKLAGQNSHVITSDGRRAGAAEQLAAFTRLLGLNLIVADTPAQLARAIARRPDRVPILIDTPGLNPLEPADCDYLLRIQSVARAEIALVLPAGLDPAEAADMAVGFKGLGATFLIATRLDQSRRLGGILAAAAAGLKLTDAGIGASVVDSLQAITPHFLAERLVRRVSPVSSPEPKPASAPRFCHSIAHPFAGQLAGSKLMTKSTPRTIAVASGKGGVGKTWFSITLAHALARKGRRVLLLDGDFGLANVDVQLGLMPSVDLGAVLAGPASLEQAVKVYEPGGFEVVAGRSGSGELSSVPEQKLEAMLRQLETLLPDRDHILLDLGAGVNRSVRAMAAWADAMFVIATEEPTSLTDAYATLKLHAVDCPDGDARLVINQAESFRAADQTAGALTRACFNFLGRTPMVAGAIRRDPHVPETIRRQALLLQRFPHSPAAVDVERIAAAL